MNSVRRETPDSDAVASSEDERPWPTAPSFGSLPRKENSVPGLGGGIWSTQRRDSFKMEKAAQRNAAREARLAAPTQPWGGLRANASPSPAGSDGSGVLPFSIPLQPVPKAGRSMSHSQGQREVPPVTGSRPGGNENATVLPLGLLTEEVDTESESELGGALTHTTSHPPIGSSLQRTGTFPSTYDSFLPSTNGKDLPQTAGGAQASSRPEQRFQEAFANLSLDHPQRRSQWQSHLGWEDVTAVNESRRHSLADIPTRRGSLAAAPKPSRMGGGAFWPNDEMYDWDNGPHSYDQQNYRDTRQLLEFGHILSGPNSAIDQARNARRFDNPDTMKHGDTDEEGRPFDIPNMYKVPYIKIEENERTEEDKRNPVTVSGPGNFGPGPRSPRKLLFIVSFKCSRVDCFYLIEGTGLFIKAGDIVIVEADRGQDLGTVQHANVTPDEARLYKRKYGEEQYKWLMMFSKNNSQGSVNPNAQLYGENNARSNLLANAPSTMQGLPRDNFNNLKPKAIKRLANSHEIRMLSEKEGNEAKAKRTCQQKVAHLHLDMEILDAEWQWDFQKLIFYYYADHYINFKDLITELYRIYKTRIWLSAINPASFSQHALGQPPSGIGPGAVVNQEANNSYTMMYGADPDPYGAVPPYRIGYETYTPNYPGIPGVPNSFAPNMPSFAGPQYGAGSGEATPSVPPGVTPTGTPADYAFYYDRAGMTEPIGSKPVNPYAGAPGAGQPTFPQAGEYYDAQFPQGLAPPPGMTNAPSMPPGPTGIGAPGDRQQLGYGAPSATTPTYPPQPRAQRRPGPIGTIPKSSGGNTFPQFGAFQPRTANANDNQTRTSFSQGAQNSGMLGRGAGAPDFVPGQAASSTRAPQRSGSIWGPGNEQLTGKDEVMKNYLAGLQTTKEDYRADEMSRER